MEDRFFFNEIEGIQTDESRGEMMKLLKKLWESAATVVHGCQRIDWSMIYKVTHSIDSANRGGTSCQR